MPRTNPGVVLLRAYQAVAQYDYAELKALLDSNLVRRAALARIETELHFASEQYASSQEMINRYLVARLGTLPRFPVEQADADTILSHGLSRLPAARVSLNAEIASVEYSAANRARVFFHVTWAGVAKGQVPPRMARLSLLHDTWLLEPSLLSDWIVPGMENILMSTDVF